MTNMENSPLLVFEYFTASGENDKSISFEAEALIRTLLDDLREFNVSVILNNTYKHIADEYENVTPIIIDENLEDYLKNNLKEFNKAIYIAGENDNHLYNIAKILEDNDIFIYNSSSKASLKASNKLELFNELQGIVPQPHTEKVNRNSIKEVYKKWMEDDSNLKTVIKPISGVDCEDVNIIENIDDIPQLESDVLFQEYVEGEDISVSLIVKEGVAIPLSINKQYLEIEDDVQQYIGGMLPYDSNLNDEILDVAIKACQHLKGLKGFVGVDLRVNNDEKTVYLIEINSRFTTPYVGLQKIANFNIVKNTIDLIDGKITNDEFKDIISFKGSVEFRKVKNQLLIKEFKK